MMLQEAIDFDMYFRCYSIDQRNVKVMNYEPRHPYHLRYVTDWQAPKHILEASSGACSSSINTSATT
jgi:hypothetical protein